MRLRMILVVAATAGLAAIGTALLVNSRSDAGADEHGIVVGAADYAWSSDRLSDWVGYTDQVAIVRVVSEEPLPMDEATRQVGEGFVGRRINVVLDRTLWVRKGVPMFGNRTSLKTTDGWFADEGKLIPYKDVGSHRAEVGDRLLVGLFRDGNFGWTMFTSGIPVGADGVVTRDADQGGIAAKLNGMSADQVSSALSAAKPDPLVAKYAHLDPYARAQAAFADAQATEG